MAISHPRRNTLLEFMDDKSDIAEDRAKHSEVPTFIGEGIYVIDVSLKKRYVP